jgi:EmrB/QacA subfamily drug resistance transporter
VAATEAKESSHLRLLAAIALASCLSPLGSTSIAVAIPAIGRDFARTPEVLTQWLVASYLVTAIVFQSPGGKVGDLFGHGRALALGQAMFALGSVVGILAPSAWVLAFARVLTAAGGAVIIPSAAAVVRTHFAEAQRARAFSVFGATMSMAAAVGPIFGGELTARFGWRAIFVANLPPLLASVLLARGLKDDERPRKKRSIDAVGAVLVGLGLGLAVIGARARRPLAIAIGAAILIAFALWERRVREPVIDLALFKTRVFTAGTSVIAFQNLGMYALLFELPVMFSRGHGVDSARTGRALLALMLSFSVCAPLGARVSERIGARASVCVGGLVAATGAWLLRDANALALPRDAMPGLALLGVGLGLCSAPSQAAAISAIAREKSGMASGLSSTMRYLGGVAGVTVLGLTFTDPDPSRLPAQHAFAIGVFVASFIASAICGAFLPGRASHP